MRFAVTGSHGLIGCALAARVREAGHQVTSIARTAETGGPWFSPRTGEADLEGIAGCDVLVHLAGAPIGTHRWNAGIKSEIYASRVRGTRAIVAGLARMSSPPPVLISASAIGYYGDRGAETLTEASTQGVGFLPRVVSDWEREAACASDLCERVVMLRTGIVLDRSGGLLRRLLPLYRLGLGGRLGSGEQYMSWLALEDEVEAIMHLATGSRLSGAVNLVGPEPLTNREFSATLAQALRRPNLVPVPRILLELALGKQMAGELALASQRVLPAALLEDGFRFLHTSLVRVVGEAAG